MSTDQELQGVSRRQFVDYAAKGLTIAFTLPVLSGPVARLLGASALAQEGGAGPTLAPQPNAFLRIGADDTVTVIVKHLEMGQGVYTGLPMIAAEELECDWSKVRVESAPADAKVYNNLFWGPAQGTGGSSSVANSWDQLRMAGAAAREMLITAAAEKLKVDRAQLKAENGFVVGPDGAKASFGELAEAAAKVTAPKDVKLKDPKDFKLIGKPNVARLDGADKTNGKAQFAMDMRRPGQLTALIARPPSFGAKLVSFDAAKAKAMPGVKSVVQIPQGVAVIAEGFWAASKARDALEIKWDEKESSKLSSASIAKQFKDTLAKKGAVAASNGKAGDAFKKATKKLEATYEFPYLAHAPMEVLNCVIELAADGKSVDVWAGDQSQTGDQFAVSKILGLPMESVRIHTMLAGGSFGRRATPTADYVAEAAAVMAAAKDLKAPIHLMWTREDDIKGGYYRPAFMHTVKAGLDAKGAPVAWDHRLIGQSILLGTPFGAGIKNNIDPASVEGVANLAYAVPNLNVELHNAKLPIPVLWWRSVGHTHTAFVAETMIDELAQMAGVDAVQYRMQHLKGKPRHQGVLKLAAEKAGWGTPLPAGKARGVAVHESFNSYVAQVVEVTVKGKEFTVDRIVCAVDCGIAVNPDNVVAQMEGGIGYGLGAVLRGAVTLEKGRPVQSNFHDYQVLRLNEMPKIEVHIVPSAERPSGVGEPGVPPVGPALANALWAATGKRLRKLPLTLA